MALRTSISVNNQPPKRKKRTGPTLRKAGLKKEPELLLHPPIIQPMAGVNPRSIMGSYQWNFVRKGVYAKQNDCCLCCGIHKSEARYRQHIECHEMYRYNYKKKIAYVDRFVGLCHCCHMFIHMERLKRFLSLGLHSPNYVRVVQDHGFEILRNSGLLGQYQEVQDDYQKRLPKLQNQFGQWFLHYNGYRYKNDFTCLSDWEAHYSQHNSGKVKLIIETLK